MFDGIESYDVRLPIESLRNGERLFFPGMYNRQTGEEVRRKQKASDDGLIFTLMPLATDPGWQCKLQGSLHRYFNQGVHNADEFTAAKLLQSIDLLVSRYAIEPGKTLLNNLEFGVNLALPFPVSKILDNLVSYKDGKPLTLKYNKVGERYAYYHCLQQRYEFKLYDKGLPFERSVPGLPANLLRIEINVTKMEYFTAKKIPIRTLADLLNPAIYPVLGKLLVKAFQNILFDEPSLDPDTLSEAKRRLYLEGSNPRYWIEQAAELRQIGERYGGRSLEYGAARQRLYKRRKGFNELLRQSRPMENWPAQTAALLAQKWTELSTVSRELASTMASRRALWSVEEPTILPNSIGYFVSNKQAESNKVTGLTSLNANKITGLQGKKANKITGLSSDTPNKVTDWTADASPKLTGSDEEGKSGKSSQSNRLDKVLFCDSSPSPERVESIGEEEVLSTSSSAVPVVREDLVFVSSDEPAPPVDSSAGDSVAAESRIRPKPIAAVLPKPVVPRVSPDLSDQPGLSIRPVKSPAQSKDRSVAKTIDTFTPVPPMFPHPSTLGHYAEYDEQGRKRRWCPLSGIETTEQRPDSVIVDKTRLASVDWSKPSNAVWLDTLMHQYLTPYQWKHSDENMRRYHLLDRMRIRWTRLHGRKP